jgi:crotonobetainyl-CoA:carnitine CoA-transferase CaiB-like acyl-CoA transferase
MAIQLRFGKLASTRPRREAVQPLANFFQTRDGRWICLLARQGSTDWARIATAAGRPELTEDPRFTSARLRRENGPALVDILDEAFGAMDYAEAARGAGRRRPDLGPLADAARPGHRSAGDGGRLLRGDARRQGRDLPRPGGAGAVPGLGGRAERPGAGLGEHTASVLAEIGWSEDEIAVVER